MGQSRVTRATLASQVEEAVRSDIIAGSLEPGQRLRATELSRRYGVSATPLREALQRLAAQNLVDLGPRLGTTVSPISDLELHDVYWMRGLLDGRALARSVELGDDEWRRGLTDAYAAFEAATAAGTGAAASSDWAVAHRRFHDTLFEACDSPWLLRFVGLLSDHSERYRMLSRRRALRPSVDEHRTIYRAAMVGDVENAKAALHRHLEATVQLLEAPHDMPASDGSGALP